MPCYVRRKLTPIDALDTGTTLLIALGVIGVGGLVAYLVFKPKEKKTPKLTSVTSEQQAKLEELFQEYQRRKEKPGAMEWLKGALGAVKIGADIWKTFIELKSQTPTQQTTPTSPTLPMLA